MGFENFPISLGPTPGDEGGGFLIACPDLRSCIADGEAIDDAFVEACGGFAAWTIAEQAVTGVLPTPKGYSGQFVLRVSQALRRQLARRAAADDVRLNQHAATYLAQGLAKR